MGLHTRYAERMGYVSRSKYKIIVRNRLAVGLYNAVFEEAFARSLPGCKCGLLLEFTHSIHPETPDATLRAKGGSEIAVDNLYADLFGALC